MLRPGDKQEQKPNNLKRHIEKMTSNTSGREETD